MRSEEPYMQELTAETIRQEIGYDQVSAWSLQTENDTLTGGPSQFSYCLC